MNALSPEMVRCVEFVIRHGGTIHRHAAGHWFEEADLHLATGEHFGDRTIAALVRRGVLAYFVWCAGIPVRAKLLGSR